MLLTAILLSRVEGTLDYAVDFRLPVGTPVVASRAGRVAAITSHFVRGGVDAKFRPRANFVAVQHSDGTYARYFHLRHNGKPIIDTNLLT